MFGSFIADSWANQDVTTSPFVTVRDMLLDLPFGVMRGDPLLAKLTTRFHYVTRDLPDKKLGS